ncbi:MAG TPA: cytochrome c peroxidase [Burkholderiaceae bacterium]|nr:cytochrome c peroxidase [Burkholderiaceae bacterium]
MSRSSAAGALALILLLAAPVTVAADGVRDSEQQRDRIIALGPWPPEVRRDPSNRVSGQPLAIALGRQLFFDPRMSPLGYIACVTCHAPDRAYSDLKPRAHGLADLERNTIALANLRQQRWYDWAGSSDSLWLASLRPILNPREFDGSPTSVARLFQRDAELAHCYRRVFGVAPTGDDERTLVNVGKALAAFLETLRTGRTAFDDYRDALVRGAPTGSYPAAAERGLRLFVGRADCVACHSGPNFSDGQFHDVGAPPPIAPARRDPGRAEGARLLLATQFNLLGRYNDDPRHAHAPRAQVTADTGRVGEFRTPSLRNVAVTGPYMHNGRVEALADAVRQHANHPLLDDAEVGELVAFLLTLTDRDGERRPVPVAVDGCISSSGPVAAAATVTGPRQH